MLGVPEPWSVALLGLVGAALAVVVAAIVAKLLRLARRQDDD